MVLGTVGVPWPLSARPGLTSQRVLGTLKMLRKPQEGAHDPQTGRRSVCIYLSTICLSIYLFLRSSETGSLPGTEGAAWGQAGLGSRL